MANQEVYITTVKLNAEEAKNKLDELSKKVADLKQKKDTALKSGNMTLGDDIAKQIKKAEHELSQFKTATMNIEEVLNNLPSASISQIQKAMKALNAQMRNLPANSEEFKKLNSELTTLKGALDKAKNSGKEASPALQKLNEDSANAAGSFERTNKEAQFLYMTMKNLSKVSTNELTAAANILKTKMDAVSPDSGAYATYNSQLKLVNAEMERIRQKQQNINTLVNQYDREIDVSQKDMATVRRETELVHNTLSHMSTSSVRDLEYSFKIINEQMRGMNRGTVEFKKMTEEAKRLKTELSAIKYEGNSQPWMDKTANWFNKMQGIAISAFATFTGITMSIRKATSDFANMDQEITDARKYTDQSAEEAQRMNKDFQKMDTRSSREQLNQLAGAAGRLGEKSMYAAEEFVDGADKINLAMHDDLGDDAVEKIGKIAKMFGEDKKLGMRGALLAAGSAVNELSSSMSANASFVVDFSSHLSGIGLEANIASAKLMGLGAVMNRNAQEEATSSTVFSQLLTKMYQDPAKFAKLAGVEVKKFSNLVKTDANEALLRFLEAMKGRGGFDKLAPMFSSMGLEGTRAVGVLSMAAAKVDDIRKAQGIANQAYKDGTSVIREANMQNNTYQAQIDKNVKKLHDLNIELGQKLLPLVSHTITLGSVLIKILLALVDIIGKYKGTIITVTATLVVLNAQKIIDVTWSKLQVLWNDKIAVGLKKLYAIMIANPYAVIAVTVAAFIAIIHDWSDGNEKVIDTYGKLIEAEREAATSAKAEQNEVSALVSIARDETKSKTERLNAIKKLNDISPAYLSCLTLESINTAKADKAIRNYTNSILLNAKAMAIKQKIQDNEKLKLDEMEGLQKQLEITRDPLKVLFDGQATKDALDAMTNWLGVGAQNLVNGISHFVAHGDAKGFSESSIADDGYGTNMTQVVLNRHNKYMRTIEQSNRILVNEFKKTESEMLSGTPVDASENTNNINYVDPKEEKKRQAAERKAAAARKRAENEKERALRNADKVAKAETSKELAGNAEKYAKGLITYRQYINAQEQITLDGISKRKKIWAKEKTQYDNLLKEEVDATKSHDEKILDLNERDVEARRLAVAAQLNAMYEDRNSTMYMNEDELNESLYENDMSASADRLSLYQKGSQEYMNLASEMNQKEKDHQLEQERNYQEMLSQYREQFGVQDWKKQETIAINGLNTLHERGKVNETEYQEWMQKLQQYYRQKSAEEEAKLKGPGSKKELFDSNVNTAINEAKAAAGDAYDPEGKAGATSNPFVGQVRNYTNTVTQLKRLYQQDKINYATYQAAKRQVTSDFLTDLASQAQAAFESISNIMSAASNYYAAQSQYEQNITTKKYDAQIKKAGENSTRGKKLEDNKQKELAAIKTKYNKKEMKMQIAQAIAQTAVAAINAYASATKVAFWMGPVAAAMATAAGMIQIAAITKQQKAEETGYYEGGFTDGSDYHKKAGAVHQGEFVANHYAVRNPNILPTLRLLDLAQRNNTVGSLTQNDISSSLGQGASVIAPVVNVSTDNNELNTSLVELNNVISHLNAQITNGIYSTVVLDGPDGLDEQYTRYKKLMNNK